MPTLDNIPFSLDIDQLLKKLMIKSNNDRAEAFTVLASEVKRVGRPKAFYKSVWIEEKGTDTIKLDGIVFTSLALRKNLDSVEHVFPYVATCGSEIEDIEAAYQTLLERSWIQTLKEELLQFSMNYLIGWLKNKYKMSHLSSMNPGSGDAYVWPFEQQRELLALCGDIESKIGVKAKKSLVMIPDVTLSGILFPSKHIFQNCQLCRFENCHNRRAEFDDELWQSIYQPKGNV